MTAPWRVATSLEKLLAEINTRSPRRSKASDGGIGNAEHASRESDHNPWVKDGSMGVVTARDFTNDPANGFDSSDFAEWLRTRCKSGAESRVKYIISDRRIASATRENWAWRPYTGPNAHLKHVHVSVLATKGRYDDARSWGWVKPSTPPVGGSGVSKPATPENDMSFKDKHTVTQADVDAWGNGKYSVGDKVSYDELVRFPPAVARVRREMNEKLDAILAQLKK